MAVQVHFPLPQSLPTFSASQQIRLAPAANPCELRKQCRHLQGCFAHAQGTQTHVDDFLSSALQAVWHSMRHLAGDRPYPPEPEPPTTWAAGVRLLDQTILWCDTAFSSPRIEVVNDAMNWDAASRQEEAATSASAEDIIELRKIKKRIDPKNCYIGESLPIMRVFEKIDTYNRSDEKSVVISGPTGAGKTEIAYMVHSSSSRKDKRFLQLQASDAFGQDFNFVRTDWTGLGINHGLPNAKGPRPGYLQNCSGGTIFLDEVHAARPEFQRFLFRVLDRREIPLAAGQGPAVKPNVRLIFGTNVDLAGDASVLSDFHRRIKGRTLEIPSLAQRLEDIPLFVQHRCNGYKWSPSFLLGLLKFTWPGNVGELLDVLDLAKDNATAEARRKSSRSGKKVMLTLDHLTGIPDRAAFQSLHKLSEDEAEFQVFRTLSQLLERQGWKPGRRGCGLQAQLARVMGTSDATIVRMAKKFGHATALNVA